MRPCWGPNGYSIFHQWIEKDGEVYALVESRDGRCKLWSYDNIRLLGFKEAYDNCCETLKKPMATFDDGVCIGGIDELRDILLKSDAVYFTSEPYTSFLTDDYNKGRFKLPADCTVEVDYNKLATAVYNAGYRRIKEDKEYDQI